MPNAQPQSRSDDDAEAERCAFNAAFYELGLRWHWDGATYEVLAATSCERARVRGYLEAQQPHLLRAYDAEFLTDAILVAKRRCRELHVQRASSAPARPNHVAPRWEEVGV